VSRCAGSNLLTDGFSVIEKMDRDALEGFEIHSGKTECSRLFRCASGIARRTDPRDQTSRRFGAVDFQDWLTKGQSQRDHSVKAVVVCRGKTEIADQRGRIRSLARDFRTTQYMP